MWIIVAGDLCSGHRFIGPFDSLEEAQEWTENLPMPVSDSYEMLDLIHPDTILELIKKKAQ